MEYIKTLDIENDVEKYIESFGVQLTPDDSFLLSEAIEKVRYYIKNRTNQGEVPEGLKYLWINRTVGEFLNFKKVMGKLDINGLNFGRIAKEISEGDTKVVFDSTKTTGDKFEVFLSSMLTYGEDEIIRYRRFVW